MVSSAFRGVESQRPMGKDCVRLNLGRTVGAVRVLRTYATLGASRRRKVLLSCQVRSVFLSEAALVGTLAVFVTEGVPRAVF